MLEIDVGEDEFVVAGVDNGRPVAAGEHVTRRRRLERAQYGRLRAKRHLLTVSQRTCTSTFYCTLVHTYMYEYISL